MGRHKRERKVLDEICTRLLKLEKRLNSDGDESRSSRARSRSRSSQRSSRHRSFRSRSPCRRRRRQRERRSSSSIDSIRSVEDTTQVMEKEGGPNKDELPSLDQENVLPTNIEELLGQEGASPSCNSFDLHDGLATRWSAILKTGLNLDTKVSIMKKYDPPKNCSLLVPPKLNEEVAAAMNESGIKRDKRIAEQQAVLGTAITSMSKVLDDLIKTKGNTHYIETLSDSGRLLCDIYHNNCITRRSLILPGLNKDMKELMEQTQISEHLFGDKLQDKVNAVKAVKKSGLELKNTPAVAKPHPKTLQKHLNYRGPQRPQVPRPSGQKPKQKRSTYPMKFTPRPRRSPPRQHYRRQDRC